MMIRVILLICHMSRVTNAQNDFRRFYKIDQHVFDEKANVGVVSHSSQVS